MDGGEKGMKRFAITSVMFLMFSTAGAQASATDVYENGQAQIDLMRSALDDERKAIVANNIWLTREEHQAFWPVYHQYRVATNRVRDKLVRLMMKYVEMHKTHSITDKEALRILDESLRLQQELVRVKYAYVKKFRNALPARKVARFYQIDNRLDNLAMLKAAQHVPLIK